MRTFKFYSLSKFQLNTVLLTIVGFPGGASGKEHTAKAGALGDMGSTWVRKIPWRRTWQSTLVFLPGETHRQRSLVTYSSKGHKELDMTEAI